MSSLQGTPTVRESFKSGNTGMRGVTVRTGLLIRQFDELSSAVSGVLTYGQPYPSSQNQRSVSLKFLWCLPSAHFVFEQGRKTPMHVHIDSADLADGNHKDSRQCHSMT
jgi:hypothetical protein